MTKDQFDGLAERVLLALISASEQGTSSRSLAQGAVDITDQFLKELNNRYVKLAAETKRLMPEEVNLLRDRNVIACIKSVRDRTQMNPKDAKDLVDAERARLGLM
jgi:hypothetical protein